MASRNLTYQRAGAEGRHIRTERSVTDYDRRTLHQHIYQTPDTYIGSVIENQRPEWVFDAASGHFIYSQVKVPQGVERIFLEPLSNAGDNVDASRRMNTDPGQIDVMMDTQTVVIRNGGEPIPLTPRPESPPDHPLYVPDDIFGVLLTSSNYDVNVIRMGCGRNGYGIKLCPRKGTPIPLFDGTFRNVEDLKVGDTLIGDDGGQRTILATMSGSGPLYEVSSPYNDPYVVSENHILSLKMAIHKIPFWNPSKQYFKAFWLDQSSRTIRSLCAYVQMESPSAEPPNTPEAQAALKMLRERLQEIPDDDVLDISIHDYLALPADVRSRLIGFHSASVQWPHQNVELDPYLVGSQLTTKMRIPREYLVNDRATRMALLAGLLDTYNRPEDIEIPMSHDEPLFDDFVYLIRSLGFTCVLTPKGFWVFGEGLESIPMRGNRISPLSTTINDSLTIRRVADGEYFGFETTGNQRFALGRDFTVTHNCNIFSKSFRARVGDPKNGQEWEGVWTDNMLTKVSSVMAPGHRYDPQTQTWIPAGPKYTGPAYVEITYQIDFERFGMDPNIGYGPEVIALFARFTIDFGFTCKIPVSFNGVVYNVQSIRDFARLYWSDEVISKAFLHYEWDGGVEPEGYAHLTKKQKEAAIASGTYIPLVEMMCLDTPDAGITLSYVDGLMTLDGGVHVSEAFSAFSENIVDKVNNAKGVGKKKKGEKISAGFKITTNDLCAHTSMILNCRLPDPQYTSQSKTTLAGPKPSISIDSGELSLVDRWALIGRLFAAIEAKTTKSLKKGERRTRGRVCLDKGEDANDAGGPRANECILYIVEGKSASSYPKKRISMTPGGKDLSGYYPIKGKFLNVMKASAIQIAKNDELQDLKRLLGLREGVNYLDEKEAATLRYGLILSTTDADTDGMHILMLLIALFHSRYPSVLQRGMFGYLLTCAVRLFDSRDNVVKRFFSNEAYEQWARENPNHKYRIKYYKGLGASLDEDIADDLNTAPVVVCIYDDMAPQTLEMAFGKKGANLRKEWIAKWRGATKIDDIVAIGASQLLKQRNITDAINYGLIDYTIEALFRAIPSVYDGLKMSQRQALFYILTKWKYGRSKADSMKVARIAGSAGELIKYHHGEKSLMDTIIKMAQDFTGSNNLGFFKKDGQFGNRDDLGADAADGRYSETRPEWWIKYAIDEEMVDLVPKRVVENEEVEPVFIPIDIPVHVINGFEGIATGFSTYSPCYDPYRVIENLHARCAGETPVPLIPAFRGFKGTIEVLEPEESKIEEKKAEEEDEVDEEVLPTELPKAAEGEEEPSEEPPKRYKRKGRTLVTLGVFEFLQKYDDHSADIKVSELPIGRAISNYRKWLELLQTEGTISGFRDNSTYDVPLFTIFRFKSARGINHVSLGLRRTFGLNNINLIDNDGYPTTYPKIDSVIDAYYAKMIEMYDKLRHKRIADREAGIRDIDFKHAFINAVITDDPSKQLLIFKRKKADVMAEMEQMGIPGHYIDKIKASGFTVDAIDELLADRAKLEGEIAELNVETPQHMWGVRLEKFYQALQDHKYTM